MLLRFTNTTLLVLLAALTLTGLYGLLWPWPAWMFEVHRIGAWGVVALIPWKVLIAGRSLRRGLDRRFNRSVVVAVSLGLAALTLLVLTLGFAWTWRVGPTVGWLWQSVLSWHWPCCCRWASTSGGVGRGPSVPTSPRAARPSS